MAWIPPHTFVAGQTAQAAHVNENEVSLGAYAESLLPWQVPIAVNGPVVSTGFSASVDPTKFIGGIRMNSTGTLNDQVGYDVVLAAGIWDLLFYVNHFTNNGIITASIDGVNLGTTWDTYGADAHNLPVSHSGIVVASSGKKRLLFKMTGKNGASSAYTGRIEGGMVLRRTS